MVKKISITWLGKPEVQDYIAAMSYLGLLYNKKATEAIVGKLKSAVITKFKAKDIFRASALPLLMTLKL